jgi:flagellar biosynthesis/type III secretory pathway chaperone
MNGGVITQCNSKWHKQFARVYALLALAEKHEWTIDGLENFFLERCNLFVELNIKISQKIDSMASLCERLNHRNLQFASLINEQKKHNEEIVQLTKQLERRERC